MFWGCQVMVNRSRLSAHGLPLSAKVFQKCLKFDLLQTELDYQTLSIIFDFYNYHNQNK